MDGPHGVHDEQIPIGMKLALWYQEMARHHAGFQKAVDDICVGQISGAVGTFAQISPKVEAYVCRKAGLSRRLFPIKSFSATAMHFILPPWRSSPAPWKSLRSKCATCSALKSRKPRSRLPQVKKAHQRCRTNAIRYCPRTFRAWRGSCAPMRWPRWKTCRFGTKEISAILPWSA